MKHFIWVLAGCLMATGWLVPGIALADIYKYVDEKGRVHYTNNPESIPGSSRNAVEVNREIKASPSPSQATTEERDAAELEGPADLAPVPDSPMAQLQKQHAYLENERKQALSQQRESLEAERQALKAESARLEEARRKANTRAEVERYNAEVDLYDQRAAGYEKQKASYQKERSVFQKEVEAYETELKKTLEGALQQTPKSQTAPAQEPPPQEETP